VSTPPYPTDNTPIRVPAGTTAQQALKDAGVPLKGPDGAVVVRDPATGDLKDLAWVPDVDTDVEPVPAGSAEGRAVIRHSTAHVLAQAVQELFPGTRLGIGPPIENGFYYDFDPERPFTPEDLQALEKKMTEIVRAGQNFARREISDADAEAELAHEPYKLELIGLKGGAGDAAEGADVESAARS
jgi:threonyl-tRNA synthetase